jgi:hypothetical protein
MMLLIAITIVEFRAKSKPQISSTKEVNLKVTLPMAYAPSTFSFLLIISSQIYSLDDGVPSCSKRGISRFKETPSQRIKKIV